MVDLGAGAGPVIQGASNGAAAAQNQTGVKVPRDAFHAIEKIVCSACMQKVVVLKRVRGAIPATDKEPPVKEGGWSALGLRDGFG